MSFVLPALPYEYNALEPSISAETLQFHHDKHHAAYVNKLNGFVQNTEHQTKTLEELIVQKPTPAIFNNAAQAWNHDFYWKCMTHGGSQPILKTSKKKFSDKAAAHFGSGWCWLVLNGEKLEIVDTHDAGNPLTEGLKPLLTLDVWEHAYYIDTRNNRPAYIEKWWNVVNWAFVESNL
ncbi:Superoxide dismutase [Fe] [Entamoeba marina]